MLEWLALHEVASRPGLKERPIAWRCGKLIRRKQFLADVRAWQTSFAGCVGPRVALYFDDSYDFAAALYGAWHANKVVYLPGDAQPATLQRLLPQVDACAGNLPGALHPTPAPPAAPLEPLDLQRAALLVYTSGTSGEPVAIHKRLAQLDAEISTQEMVFGSRLGHGTAPTVYTTVSHQHIYGLLFVTLWPLAAGRPFVAERLTYPEEMAAQLGPHSSILVSSPAHLKRLPEQLDWCHAREGLHAVFSSGGPLPPEASQACFELLQHSPIEVFGSSETGGIAWRQRAVHGDRWNPLPGVEWRLDDELLAVRSPHLSDENWWLTADRVRAIPPAEGGGFVLLGRADRIAKIEEKRISLTSLEAALVACPEVAEARALVLNKEGKLRLAVVVVPSAAGWSVLQHLGKQALNKRLRSALLQDLERVALPRSWRYVQTLPVNPQGKSTEVLLTALFRPLMPVPQWTLREPHVAQALLQLTPDLLVFDGHFLEQPILPGIAQLDWALELARACFRLPARFMRADALKFQRTAAPGVQLQLDLQWNADTHVLTFRYSSTVGSHASGRIAFGADE